jgi:rhodanese-related sulfurtransferase
LSIGEKMSQVIIDIRENDEFESEHIQNSIHLPLADFQSKAASLVGNLSDKEIVLMCRSGLRAKIAHDQGIAMGLKNLSVYEGGILEWKKQGNPTIVAKGGHFPIMRQVHIAAGGLVLLSVGLASFVDFKFIGIAAFVGGGLTVAGITGFCGMAHLLSRMPWNKVS